MHSPRGTESYMIMKETYKKEEFSTNADVLNIKLEKIVLCANESTLVKMDQRFYMDLAELKKNTFTDLAILHAANNFEFEFSVNIKFQFRNIRPNSSLSEIIGFELSFNEILDLLFSALDHSSLKLNSSYFLKSNLITMKSGIKSQGYFLNWENIGMVKYVSMIFLEFILEVYKKVKAVFTDETIFAHYIGEYHERLGTIISDKLVVDIFKIVADIITSYESPSKPLIEEKLCEIKEEKQRGKFLFFLLEYV